MDVACVVYRALLSLYPARFRAEFDDEMTQTFRDHIDDARQSGEGAGLSFWCEVLADVIMSAFYQRVLGLWNATLASLLSALMGACLFLTAYGALVTLSLRLPHPPVAGIAFPMTLAALLAVSAGLSGAAVRAVSQYARR